MPRIRSKRIDVGNAYSGQAAEPLKRVDTVNHSIRNRIFM